MDPTVGHWQALYASDLQGIYALWVVPVAFLLYIRLFPPERPSMVAPGATGLMGTYALVFAVETILDPFASGLMVPGLGLADSWVATATMFLFVLLGDFRALLLIFYLVAVGRQPSTGRPAEVALPKILRSATAWTLVVPIATGIVVSLARAGATGALHPHVLWLVYELGFLALTCWIRSRIIRPAVVASQAPIGAYLRDVTTYVALYYALWATADVVIMAGYDVGWAIRMVPNQLYYAFYLPVVYGLFFSSWYVETNSPAHASR